MAIVSEAVLKVIITDEDQNNVQVEFNAGKVPLDAITVSLEMVLERLKVQSPIVVSSSFYSRTLYF